MRARTLDEALAIAELVREAVDEACEDGVLAADTCINLNNAGIDPATIMAVCRGEEFE